MAGAAPTTSETALREAVRARKESLLEDFGRHLGPSLLRLFRFMGLDTLEWDGEGAVCRDVDGREYLDFNGCVGTLFLGRRHPRVVAAVREQLERLTFTSRVLPHLPQIELARRLAEITPGDLELVFFCNSGTEAVEAALKLARAATGRTEFVAAWGAFHGKTFGSLSVSGRPLYRDPFQPLLPGVTHVPYGDAKALEQAVTERTAAVILEPIQGEGGVIVPPDDYLPQAREICRRKGALLIVDEVQTGMGRTGAWWACDHLGVVPDILCTAKALGGGVMPIGAIVARPEVFRPFDENPFIHSSTFGGNALACAAGVAAVDAIREEGLLEQAREKGRWLREGLRQVQQAHPAVIREVRGKGLMIGVELAREGLGGFIIADILQNGLIAIHSLNNERVIRFLPPAVVTYEQLQRGLDIFAAAVARAERYLEELE